MSSVFVVMSFNSLGMESRKGKKRGMEGNYMEVKIMVGERKEIKERRNDKWVTKWLYLYLFIAISLSLSLSLFLAFHLSCRSLIRVIMLFAVTLYLLSRVCSNGSDAAKILPFSDYLLLLVVVFLSLSNCTVA